MTLSEKICNDLGAKFFSKSFTYENLKYFNVQNNKVELCDGLFEYLNNYVALQIKERNTKNISKTDEDWIKAVVYGEAVKQIKETIYAIKTDSIIVNDLYHQPVNINSDYTIYPIIIFDNPSIKEYQRIVHIENETKTIVNVFNLYDYQSMMETLVHPYDIIDYLENRISWLDNLRELPDIIFGEGNNISIISKIKTEKDFASFFEKFVYDGVINKKNDALQLLALINQFHEKQYKKCSQYKTVLQILQKIKPKLASAFMDRFWNSWNNACNKVKDYSKAICIVEENKKTSIVFYSTTSEITKEYYYMLCDAKQQQHKVDAILLIVFMGESETECRIDWIYFEKPFIEEPEVLNKYIKMGLIPSKFTVKTQNEIEN